MRNKARKGSVTVEEAQAIMNFLEAKRKGWEAEGVGKQGICKISICKGINTFELTGYPFDAVLASASGKFAHDWCTNFLQKVSRRFDFSLFMGTMALSSWPGHGATKLITFTRSGSLVLTLPLPLPRHMSYLGQSHRSLLTLQLVPLQSSFLLSRRSGLSAPFLARHCLAAPAQGHKCSWWATIGCTGFALTFWQAGWLFHRRGPQVPRVQLLGNHRLYSKKGWRRDQFWTGAWWTGGGNSISSQPSLVSPLAPLGLQLAWCLHTRLCSPSQSRRSSWQTQHGIPVPGGFPPGTTVPGLDWQTWLSLHLCPLAPLAASFVPVHRLLNKTS